MSDVCEFNAQEVGDFIFEVYFVFCLKVVLEFLFDSRAFTKEYEVFNKQTQIEWGLSINDLTTENAGGIWAWVQTKAYSCFLAGLVPVVARAAFEPIQRFL